MIKSNQSHPNNYAQTYTAIYSNINICANTNTVPQRFILSGEHVSENPPLMRFEPVEEILIASTYCALVQSGQHLNNKTRHQAV